MQLYKKCARKKLTVLPKKEKEKKEGRGKVKKNCKVRNVGQICQHNL